MFIKVRRTFTVCAILLLLGLFILPCRFLQGWCEELNELCDQVLTFAETGELASAETTYGTLRQEYKIMRKGAELFLDHRVMDDATLPLTLMGVYLRAGDQVGMEAAAAEFRQALDCMLSIERGDLRFLL